MLPKRPKYIPIRITREREKEIKERHFRIITIDQILTALQTQALVGGLSMDERGAVMRLEHELKSWIDEDIQDWLMLGGGQDYRRAKQLYELARALRKGGYFGMPVI